MSGSEEYESEGPRRTMSDRAVANVDPLFLVLLGVAMVGVLVLNEVMAFV